MKHGTSRPVLFHGSAYVSEFAGVLTSSPWEKHLLPHTPSPSSSFCQVHVLAAFLQHQPARHLMIALHAALLACPRAAFIATGAPAVQRPVMRWAAISGINRQCRILNDILMDPGRQALMPSRRASLLGGPMQGCLHEQRNSPWPAGNSDSRWGLPPNRQRASQ